MITLDVNFPLLAFGLAETGWFLGWLALGGVPLLIHLLNKRRFKETEWAAMRFLLEAVRKNARRIQIEQLILLLVRITIVCLVVFAFARPFLDEYGSMFAVGTPVHRIIVIDASFSMNYAPADRTRFDRARAMARQLVEEGQPGDASNLVRISGSEPRMIVVKPAFAPEEVVNEIEQLTLTHEVGEAGPSLAAVVKLLQAAPELPRKEVYLISDFQRTTWSPDDAGKAAELRRTLQQIGAAARLTLLDLGQTSSRNSAVTDFRAVDEFVATGRPQRFKASVTTFGTTALSHQLVEFLVDGKLQEQQSLDLQPGAESVVYFTTSFRDAARRRLQVRLAPDPLPLDDVRWLTALPRDKLRVLCVNGKLAGRPSENATFHLELALAPRGSSGAATSWLAPTVIKASDLRGFDLSEFDAVCLCNVGALSAAEAQILDSFLHSGGGVLWFLGDRVQPENYNALYKDGQGILPAKLGGRRGDPELRGAGFAFDPLDFAHPAVQVFQGNPDSGLQTTRTYAYWRPELGPQSRARVVLAYDTGDPAIVETDVGSGRSILVTPAIDGQWSNWALWPSFVPLIQELVLHAVAGKTEGRRLTVGEPWQRTLQTRGADVPTTVIRPDGETEAPIQERGANVTAFSYDHTNAAGVYEVQFGPPLGRKEAFAVNLDPRESNLAKLERDEFERDLLPGTNFSYNTEQIDAPTPVETPAAPQRAELAQWLLYLALYLLFVEQMLAWNFQAGLWLLCPPAALWLKSRAGR